ncbi:MAG TPA: hypothetical protein VGN81_32295 [Pseudonocardiaceae bacterium]
MELSDLGNNVYGSVTDDLTTKELADLFAMAGWSASSSSWTDYQVSNAFAEIEFYDQDKNLVCEYDVGEFA